MGATDIIKVGTIISIKLFMVEMKAESDIFDFSRFDLTN